MNRSTLVLCLALAPVTLGCTKKPVLYPNPTYQRVGPDIAERDVETCIEWAKEMGARGGRAGRVAGDTVEGAAVGGAAGAAAGAVRGRPGLGAATGAAGLAAGSFVRGIFRSRDPDPVERRFVEQCLRERGYQPIGWR